MMILPNRKDAIHKAWLYRILEAIADDQRLASVLFFKGGTCASSKWLNRLSVDLDFDYAGDERMSSKPARRWKIVYVTRSFGKDKVKRYSVFLRYEDSGSRGKFENNASFPLFRASKYAL
jgi:predicted nucleotidyltransferase component of viral defense system